MRACPRVVLIVVFPLAGLPIAQAADNPALWKHRVQGEFDTVLANLKSGLETAQFLISGEEDLAKGLENNKHLLGGDLKWNTIGFDRDRVHFCSIVFNHEVFNIDMDWSVLCPFKVVAYTMKEAPRTVHLVLVRPTYLLRNDRHRKARDVGQRIEDRIVNAIRSGTGLELPK